MRLRRTHPISLLQLRAFLRRNVILNEVKPLIEIRNMDATDEYFVGTCTHTDESDEIDSCAKRRLVWLRGMHEKGLRVKVATLDDERAGFLYAIPIEFCPWGPLGHDSLVIPCLYVLNNGHGVGKALITAAEEEARRQSRKAVVTIGYRHDLGWGYEAPKDGVREAIVQALRRWECDSKSCSSPTSLCPECAPTSASGSWTHFRV